MMTKEKIRRLYRELSSAAAQIRLFEIFLGMLVALILSLIITRFFLLDSWWLLLPLPITYGIVRILLMLRFDPIRIVEDEYPNYGESLRTAWDNYHTDNEMVRALESDILVKSKQVETSIFFSPKGFYTKIVIFLCLLFVYTATAGYDYRSIIDLYEQYEEPLDGERIRSTLPWLQRVHTAGTEGASDLEAGTRIYGNESIYEEGVSEIPLELEATRGALDLSTIREIRESEFDEYAPRTIRIQGAEYYEESIPVEKYTVVRNYFSEGFQ